MLSWIPNIFFSHKTKSEVSEIVWTIHVFSFQKNWFYFLLKTSLLHVLINPFLGEDSAQADYLRHLAFSAPPLLVFLFLLFSNNFVIYQSISRHLATGFLRCSRAIFSPFPEPALEGAQSAAVQKPATLSVGYTLRQQKTICLKNLMLKKIYILLKPQERITIAKI